jgi:hypothetical protein
MASALAFTSVFAVGSTQVFAQAGSARVDSEALNHLENDDNADSKRTLQESRDAIVTDLRAAKYAQVQKERLNNLSIGESLEVAAQDGSLFLITLEDCVTDTSHGVTSKRFSITRDGRTVCTVDVTVGFETGTGNNGHLESMDAVYDVVQSGYEASWDRDMDSINELHAQMVLDLHDANFGTLLLSVAFQAFYTPFGGIPNLFMDQIYP